MWQFIGNILALALRSISDKPVDSSGQREHCTPSCSTDANHRYNDEQRFEYQLSLGEEGKSQVDEDKIFRQLGEDLEEVFGGELCSAGHVVVSIMLQRDSTEMKCDDS